MKFLLGIMHPRRLKFFLESLDKVDFVDVLLAENMEAVKAEDSIRRYALENGYDRLILTSDDIVIPLDGLKRLMETVEAHPDWDIVSGWSYVRPNMKIVNLTLKPINGIDEKVGKPLYLEQYGFMKESEVLRFLREGVEYVEVWFVGYSLTCMSRNVMMEWEPRGWYFNPHREFKPSTYKGVGGFWASNDLWFSYQTWKKGFKKYADLKVYVPHHPVGYSHGFKDILVGKEKERLKFIKCGNPIF